MKPAPIERESAFLMLILQSAIGLVSAAGPIVLALGGSPGNALLAVLTILLALLELVFAVLFLRGSRRAAAWLAGYQALCLTGATLALAVHLGADGHFAPLVTNLAVPTLLLVLLLRARRQSGAAGADQVDHPVEEPVHAGAAAAEVRPAGVHS